jgi:hypothetical protein
MAQQIKITHTSNADMNIGITKNLTAVEWLYQKMFEYQGRITKEDYEQAKAMEREQIINAHGLKYYDITEEVINGEQYYNETYNK